MKLGAVMPTFNQARYLVAAVESVADQVDELVIVDDGSTDETPALIADLTARWPHVTSLRLDPNGGTAEAINAGVLELSASCDWLTWVSSDNVMASDWRGLLEAAAAGDVGAVYSAFWYERPGQAPQVLFTPHERGKQLTQEACYYGPGFAIRRSVWQEHRGRISHDLDNWLRVEESCWAAGLRIVGVDAPLCHYNAHDERVTVTRAHEYDAPHWLAEAKRRRAEAAA